MEGQRPKSNLEVVLTGLKKHPILMKISLKAILKNTMEDIFLQLMFNILKNYRNFPIIYHFYLKE